MCKSILKYIVLLTLLGAVILIASINIFFYQDLPSDPASRIELLQELELYAEAEKMLERSLEDAPLDLDLHYHYITNHFSITSEEDDPKNDETFEARYRNLAARAQTADLGNYGLGRIYAEREEHETALEFYQKVSDREQKYLNNSMGRMYLALGDTEAAKAHFLREIELQGNVGGAVHNLLQVYQADGNVQGIRELLDNPLSAEYVSLSAQRILHFRTGEIGKYFWLAFVAPFAYVDFGAVLISLFICVMWVLYFWRVDVFEQEPAYVIIVALLLGALSASFSLTLSDTIDSMLPIALGSGALSDLVYSVLHIGLVEETAKFLPVVLVVLLFTHDNEPVDYVIYGGLSALGFATMENSMYLTNYGLEIGFNRFLLSTTLHISLTGYVAYSWARARYIKPGSAFVAALKGLAVASVLHGLYDYFIIGPFDVLFVVSLLVLVVSVSAYGRMIRNTLNFSPFFDQTAAVSKRLNNYKLLLPTAITLISFAYLYNNLRYSTDIANGRLVNVNWLVIGCLFVIFGAVGELGLRKGEIHALWKK